MNEVHEAVREIQEAFASPAYPRAFLEKYDQLECLNSHDGIETFLVQGKADFGLYVAKCYDLSLFGDIAEIPELNLLSHGGLPRFSDTFQSNEMVCSVREYIEGVPLDEYAQENALAREQATAICIALSDILIYLHSRPKPIIHRDIKPQNIIIRPDGTPVLIDFDIARTYKGDADTDTRFFGTKGYAAPEQYGFAETDVRADIFSFGVLLRFLLTGNSRANPNVRFYAPLSRIVDKCTAFSPKDRYPDMSAVRRALLLANPRAQVKRAFIIAAGSLAAIAALAFTGLKIYEYVTFDPFADGHIPIVATDVERTQDAIAYLEQKYGTHLFDATEEYATFGLLRQSLVEIYGMEESYIYTMSEIDPPMENEKCFFPWGVGNEQYVDRKYMAYVAVKAYWPDKVADWSSIKDDNGEYPGIRVALEWCDEVGLLTGVNRPDSITRGQAAIALANADRIFEAMNAQK